MIPAGRLLTYSIISFTLFFTSWEYMLQFNKKEAPFFLEGLSQMLRTKYLMVFSLFFMAPPPLILIDEYLVYDLRPAYLLFLTAGTVLTTIYVFIVIAIANYRARSISFFDWGPVSKIRKVIGTIAEKTSSFKEIISGSNNPDTDD